MSAKYLPFLFPLLLFSATLLSQNALPVVSNVTLTEREDCSFIVDITYDVFDADGDSMTVTLMVSADNGLTWGVPASEDYLSGDIGEGIFSGTSKSITWDFGVNHPDTVLGPVRVRVLADDGYQYVPGMACPGVTSVFYMGKSYSTVLIGNQCWFRVNLNVGTMVVSTSTGVSHSDCSNNGVIEKYCYNNDSANCDLYGGLYDWDEMMAYDSFGPRGICPVGWHIPSDSEWCAMTTFLDTTVNCEVWAWSGTDAGGKMKKTGTDFWWVPNTGATNLSGFRALGGGNRQFNGTSFALKQAGLFWSSSTNPVYPDMAVYRELIYNLAKLKRGSAYKTGGMSVRCVKDD